MSSFTKTCTTNSSEEDAEQLRRGPWTPEEDSLLMHYISCHGEGHWNSLAQRAGLRRTGKSCRLRWLNYLKPDVKRGNLTPGEQYLILELHSKLGNRWSKIAQHLPGRTDNEIKNYWRTRVQKQARLLKVDANSGAFRDVVRCFWMPRLLQKMESEHPTHVQATDQTSTEQIVARQGQGSLSEAVECLEQQNSESEKGASSCVSSSESMNNNPSQLSEFAEYQTSPFGIVGDHNEFAKDCYYVDNNNNISSSCYDMETINLASTSEVGDDGCHMAENDWVNDGIWSIWGSSYGNQGASIGGDAMLFSSQFHQ